MNLRTLSFLLLLCLSASWTAEAQAPARPKRKKRGPGPTALLIMLPTYQSRLKHLQGAENAKLLTQLNKDRNGMWKSMLKDFGSYFSYCPVYFFVDTNYDAVIRQDFDGVLLDTSLQAVNNPSVRKGDTTYMIGSYTHHARQKGGESINDKGVKETRMYNGDMEASSMEKLVLHNYRMEQLQLPAPRVPANVGVGYNRNEARRRYTDYARRQLVYRSKKFNIVYKPSAALTDIALTIYYGRISQ